MPNKIDFDRSWKRSREETIRLIEHIQATPPHEVKNTLWLKGVRQVIPDLTRNLAEISELIFKETQGMEDRVEDLE